MTWQRTFLPAICGSFGSSRHYTRR
jgi:hypothetical protein